jgi:hypothetical protein
MRDLSYNRLLEYPSKEVEYGSHDPNIQIIFKEQDFIQILLRYLVSLFKTVGDLYEFSEVYKLYKRELDEKNEDEEGFMIKAEQIIVNSVKDRPPILSQKDRRRIEIQINKREILLMCYSILESICFENEINQNFLSQYLPIMQMHSFFFPEVILTIGKLFCSNQEILLKIKKKTDFSSKMITQVGLNKATGFELISLSSIDQQATHLINSFNQEEGITSGASNIFYFYCYYLLKTDSLDIRQKILELFTKLSAYEGESISTNQDEVYNQIRNNFKDLIRTQFYTMSSRETDLMIINPTTLKAMSIASIFKNHNDQAFEIGMPLKWKENIGKIEEKSDEVKLLKKNSAEEMNEELDSLRFSDLEDENKPLTTTLQELEEKLAEIPFQTLPNYTEESIDPRMKTARLGDLTGGQKQVILFEPDEQRTSRSKNNMTENIKFTADQKLFILIQLNFYAGMVLDRNYTWKDMIEQNGFFNLDVLLHNLLLKFESYDPNASLLRILQHMFIDQQPLFRMLIPQYMKVVGGFNDDDIGLSPSLKDSHRSEKRPVGYNLDVQVSHEPIRRVQKKILSYFLELKRSIKLLPLTFEELRDPEKFEQYKEHQNTIVNQFTLEMAKTVQQLFEFGQYQIKVMPSQQKYMTHLLLKASPECNIIPILRIMVRLLEFEPEYPEAKVLFTTLKKAILKMKSNDKISEEFNKELQSFKYAEAYDKIVMVEDVENKEDEAYSMFETYFRQYIIKDIAFKNYFKYKNLNLQQIKAVIMSILEALMGYISDSYANRAIDVFESSVKSENLVERILAREFVDDNTKIQKIFSEKIEENLDKMMPPIAYTGLSLDFMDEKLKDQTNVLNNSFDINTIVGQSLFPSLLLLFAFNQESEILSSKSIELLIKVFSQRVQITRNLNEIAVIHGKEDTKQIQKIKKDLQYLTDLCDSSETWIRSPDDDLRLTNLAKVVNRVDWYCRLLSNAASENMGTLDIVDLDTFSIDNVVQEMFRHLKVHLTIVDFIRDTFIILAEDYEAATDPQILFYFQILFLFLRKFCYKNKKNQELMAKEITVFLQECPVEVGQASLIIEIYKDNEVMCRTMQSLVTDDFLKWILKSGRRERFVDFFINLMKCNDTYLLDNQRRVLELFLDHPRKLDLLYVTQEKVEASDQYELKMQFEPRVEHENRFYQDQPYKYHAKILRLMTYACAGKSSVFVNEVKVRNLFKLQYLLDILTLTDAMTDFGEFQRAILYSMMPADDEEHSQDQDDPLHNVLSSHFIKKRKEDVHEELLASSVSSPKRGKFDLKVKGAQSPKPQRVDLPRRKDRIKTITVADHQIKAAGGRRVINILKIAVIELLYFVYFESSSLSEEVISYAGAFITLFRDETDRLKNIDKESITPDYVEFLFGNLLRMAVAIETLLMKEKTVLEDEELSDFKMSTFVNEFANKFELFEDHDISKYVPEIKNLSRLFNFDFGPRIDKLSKSSDFHAIEKMLPEAERSDIWRYLWTKFREAIKDSQKIKESVHEEKQILSKALNQIEDLFKIPIIDSPDIEAKVKKILINVNKKRIIRSIIDFVDENYKEPSRRNTISEVLYCLGGMIPFNEEGMVDDDNEVAVRREQAFLEECGATSMIMKQLSDPLQTITSDDYNINLFRFACFLLRGGNRYIQGELFEYMKTESSSEVFFSKVYILFQKETEFINKDQVSSEIPIVLSVLKLIQHFAEGHYQELQLYMRAQTNSLRSYNLLEEVVTLLSSYLSCKKAAYYELIVQCFETITELIQGPCFENQKFLMQGRMMETLSKLLSVDEFYLLEAEKRKLGSGVPQDELRPWMIAKIKHKCSIALISLVECRLDNSVLTKMYTNLRKFLFDNIISFYINFKEIYKDQYNEDSLEHVEVTPMEGKDELFCSVIIQTAFNYYTIIQKNLEEDDEESDSSQEEQEENLEKKLDEEKRELEENDTTAIPEPTTLDELKRYLDYHRAKAKVAAFEFMRSKTRTIEVVRQDEYLEKVYFLTVPYFEAITDNIKDQFNLDVSRISCKTKCNDLLEASGKLLAQLRRERDILKNKVFLIYSGLEASFEEL